MFVLLVVHRRQPFPASFPGQMPCGVGRTHTHTNMDIDASAPSAYQESFQSLVLLLPTAIPCRDQTLGLEEWTTAN